MRPGDARVRERQGAARLVAHVAPGPAAVAGPARVRARHLHAADPEGIGRDGLRPDDGLFHRRPVRQNGVDSRRAVVIASDGAAGGIRLQKVDAVQRDPVPGGDRLISALGGDRAVLLYAEGFDTADTCSVAPGRDGAAAADRDVVGPDAEAVRASRARGRDGGPVDLQVAVDLDPREHAGAVQYTGAGDAELADGVAVDAPVCAAEGVEALDLNGHVHLAVVGPDHDVSALGRGRCVGVSGDIRVVERQGRRIGVVHGRGRALVEQNIVLVEAGHLYAADPERIGRDAPDDDL